MTSVSRSVHQIIITLSLFLAMSVCGLLQINLLTPNPKVPEINWSDWKTWLSPLPNRTPWGMLKLVPIRLKDVCFIDSQHGWVVGGKSGEDIIATQKVDEAGFIIATDDGGKTWQTIEIKITTWLNSVHFVDAQHGWVVGNDGVIIATENGGKKWKPQQSTVKTKLNSVRFVDEKHGWVVGEDGVIVATEDGGKKWKLQQNTAKTSLNSVHFVDAQHGWVVGNDGVIVTTENGGKEWNTLSLQFDTKQRFNSVYFVDVQHGWIVENSGWIIATENGGKTWQRKNRFTETALNSVYFINTQRGWFAGDSGELFASNDGGKELASTAFLYLDVNINAVRFSDKNHGWAVGDLGTIAATEDGGIIWDDRSILQPNATFSDHFFNVKLGNKLVIFPSPLVLLLLLITGSLSIYRLYRYWSEPSNLQGGISDAPINRVEKDCLRRSELVKTFASLIRNRDTVPPLAIAITAPWGSGKSSMLGLLQDELQGEVFVVHLNAWHYQNDSAILSAVMEHIRDALPPFLSVNNLKFRLRLLWLRCFTGSGVGNVLAVLLGGAAVFFFAKDKQWYRLTEWLNSELATLIPSLPPPFAAELWFKVIALGLSVLVIYRLLKSWLAEFSAFSPELVALVTNLGKSASEAMQLADWSKDTGLRFRFAQDFNNVTDAFGKGRLLLLIDDLDRCEPKQIESVMATLNFLFSTPAPCYAVLAMDSEYVTNALGLAFRKLAIAHDKEDTTGRKFAKRYLEKIVQISVDLPTLDSSAVAALIDHSQKEMRPNWWRRLRKLMHKRYSWLSYSSTNPIKRFLLKLLFRPLWLLVWLWRTLEANLWAVWQGLKKFNIKMLTPVYDVLFIAILSIGLAWSGVQLTNWLQTIIPQKKVETIITAPKPVKSTTATPAPEKKTVEVNEPKTTSVPVVTIYEPLYSTDYWLAKFAAIFTVLLLVMIWLSSLRVQDTKDFIDVIKQWKDFLAMSHGTPREWKRLLNRARLFAMRVRVNQEKPWYAAFDECWRRFRLASFSTVTAEPDKLDERLAIHLMMLDVYSKGELVKNLPSLLDMDDGRWQVGLNTLDDSNCSWAYFPVLNDFFDKLEPHLKETPKGKQARAQFNLWLGLYAGLNKPQSSD